MSKNKNLSVYFNDDEEFDSVLGKTSYYISMQNYISKLVSSYDPYYLIEFGSGNGNTAIRIAKENPNTSIVAVDIREQLINDSGAKKDTLKVKNLTFVHGDLTKLENYNLINVDIVLLVYSYNFIDDPLEQKKEFLSNLFSKMKEGAKVIIGDWFLNDTKTYDENDIKTLYKARVTEGAKSVFWNMLDGKENEHIENAHDNFDVYNKHHKNLLKNVILRKNIYPTSKKWLIDTAVEVGFSVLLEDYINNINDAVIVLKK